MKKCDFIEICILQNQKMKEILVKIEFFEQNRIPQLPNLEKIMCDEVLTLEEITKSLKLLPNNKSPGSDGFTTNFYKFFWVDIKAFLFDSFRYSFTHGTLSNDQKLGVLNLIPKTQKDLRCFSNWHPVSLLQTDYKKRN